MKIIIVVFLLLLVPQSASAISSGELLAGVNQVRASHNAAPLVYNQQLTNSAIAKGQDMCSKNYWEHGNWVSFINASGYSYYKASENLAHGFDTSQAAITGWVNSPSHFANMIDPVLKDTGFGIINCPGYQGKPSDTILVEHFGTPNGVVVRPQAPPQPKPVPVQKPVIKQAMPVALVVEKPKPIEPAPDRTLYNLLVSMLHPRTSSIVKV